MKKTLTFISFLFSFLVSAQEGIPLSSFSDEFKRSILDDLDLYNRPKHAINDYTFNKQFKEIFSTVVLTNSNVINNGSAFSYNQDNDKHTFSANFAFMGKGDTDIQNNLILDLGVNMTGTNNDFIFYGDGGWSQDIGGKIGLSFKLNSTQFFLENIKDKYITERETKIIPEITRINQGTIFLEQRLKQNSPKLIDSLKNIRNKLKELLDKRIKLLNNKDWTGNVSWSLFLAKNDSVYEDAIEFIKSNNELYLKSGEYDLDVFDNTIVKYYFIKLLENERECFKINNRAFLLYKSDIISSINNICDSIEMEDIPVKLKNAISSCNKNYKIDFLDQELDYKTLNIESVKDLKKNALKYFNIIKAHNDSLMKKYTDNILLMYEMLGVTEVAKQESLVDKDSITTFYINESVVQNKKNEIFHAYDSKLKVFHGYSFKWFNINANFANNSFGISNDSILTDSIFKEKGLEKITTVFRPAIEGSLNYNHLGIRTLQAAQLYSRFTWGSFLDAPFYDKDNTLYKITTQSLSIVDKDGDELLPYNEITENIQYMDVGGYYTIFYAFERTLGITGRLNLNFPVKNETSMPFKPNYSFYVGPIFRVVGADSWSKATFALNCGFEKQLYDENAWDNFQIKASVGVPFSIFEKKE
ncbi:hypothetical protein SAMN05216480_10671 [Pustulibacterium marinum]|uniref:Uncharacterized protein n=1 Tax=Pustulibacterium marinum TaxID=1224947 RepID=A0A1I7GXI9_9FLAO|nr:hypothetical protein [Pustulibacterium marinum]SFU53143.1 hypothetical protein SAMN05216480_10671 [Pustulibacterium marinum]